MAAADLPDYHASRVTGDPALPEFRLQQPCLGGMTVGWGSIWGSGRYNDR